VVSANLESLVSPHDETNLSSSLRREDLDLAGSSLLPLGSRLVESEELGSPGRIYQQGRSERQKISSYREEVEERREER